MVSFRNRNYTIVMTLVRLPCHHLQHIQRIKHLRNCPKCGATRLDNLKKAVKKITENKTVLGKKIYQKKGFFDFSYKVELFIYLRPHYNSLKTIPCQGHFSNIRINLVETTLTKIRLKLNVNLSRTQ